MPAVQTTYRTAMRAGLNGQPASEWGSRLASETRVVEGTDGIGFGKVVSVGTGDKGAVVGGAIGDVLGVSIRDVTLVAMAGETVDTYQDGNNMAVLNEGDMWVDVTKAVTAGETAEYEPTTGAFSPVASGVALPGSRWLTTAATNTLAAVRFTRTYHNT